MPQNPKLKHKANRQKQQQHIRNTSQNISVKDDFSLELSLTIVPIPLSRQEGKNEFSTDLAFSEAFFHKCLIV